LSAFFCAFWLMAVAVVAVAVASLPIDRGENPPRASRLGGLLGVLAVCLAFVAGLIAAADKL
jgi:hypothetical protein